MVWGNMSAQLAMLENFLRRVLLLVLIAQWVNFLKRVRPHAIDVMLGCMLLMKEWKNVSFALQEREATVVNHCVRIVRSVSSAWQEAQNATQPVLLGRIFRPK